MAYYSHREHPDKSTVDFMSSMGSIRVSDCSPKHSVWSLYYRKIYIPLDKIVNDIGKLMDVLYSQAYSEGRSAGKQESLTTINQHFSDLLFKQK